MVKYLILFLLAFIVQDCSESSINEETSLEHASLESENNREVSEIESLYQEYCGGCHGRNINSFVDRKWIYGNGFEEIKKAIVEGYEEEGMSSFAETFTEEEIDDLTNFILDASDRADKMKEVIPSFVPEEYESNYFNFKLAPVVTGIEIPWGLEFLPDGSILISDREGALYHAIEGEKKVLSGFPEVKAVGQGGMMDILIHPNYSENGWIYFSYTKPKNSIHTTAVFRAKLVDDALVEKQELFEALPYLRTPYHFGCRMAFDNEGYLYLSVGDRGKRDENPQSLENHCGKIHRLYDDGSIPRDNPFVNTAGAMPSIYSFGHRNPQGLIKHPYTGEIWEHEHGPKGGDEINLIKPAINYGWPVISYGINYNGTKFTDLTHKEGMEQPVHQWTPSIAPCGMTIIRGNMYPEWKGDILSGSLSFELLQRTKIKDGKVVEEEELLKGLGRVRNVKMGPGGYIYVAIEKPKSGIFRIHPI